ncbi:ABC transporter substrate-binding protein [Natronincola ferrireducens]|uniref:Peptide/nickel transport system substrate-binding protein n=1 Tax=Natronincola ferrireducens TaxID=393762 RepID=A0A1G9GKQ0_9FIRM|nr:ABC transporter substrate-binding protein [Natronincola ferrireducens]SDL01095.1 peptide/nickel transport system substrate-binding protein [Natronincola ferrireducens]
MRSRRFKKYFSLTMIVVLIAGMVLTGCGGKEGETSNPAQEISEVTVPQHLVIGEQFDLKGYDPGSSMSDFVRALVYNNLVELDMDFKKSPGLAESWETSGDGTIWTFELRQNVVFHDGSPWDAEAAKINLDIRKEGTGKGWLTAVEEVEVVGSHTLAVHLKEPVYTFDSDLTPPFLAMVSPKAFDEEGNVIEAIGTGPFKLTSWTTDSEFVMERNEDYFAGAPILEKITFKVIPDAETRAMALQAGEIDMMSGREALTAVQRLKAQPNMKLVKEMSQTSEVLFFNVYEGPFNDIKVRQAVAHAINFDEMVPVLLEDLAEAPMNFFSQAYGEYMDNNLSLPKYDVDKAKELLREAGWEDKDANGILEKNREPLKARLVLGAKNEEDKILSAVIQDKLKDIGMEIELVHLEGGALREALTEKDYDMIMIGQWSVPHDDPTSHYLRGYWHSDSSYTIYTSSELDAKIEKLHLSLDTAERLKLHREIQAEILENTSVLMVFHRNNVMVMNEKVQDFEISTGTWQIFRGLTKTSIR